ncbi:MAG: hypothetical protein WAM66_03540 [Acidobacteriaceae bacterium]
MVRSALIGATLSLFCIHLVGQSTSQPEFTSFEQAKVVLTKMPSAISPKIQDAAQWSAWVRSEDGKIRHRLVRGEEDTLTNFLRSGVTFTSEPRISNRELLSYGQNAIVTARAGIRANDLIHAMSSEEAVARNERVAHMRAFLKSKSFSFATPTDREKIRTYLLHNLARMRDEFLKYVNEPKGTNTFEMFKNRGISLDTNLYPDFLIDQHLRHMIQSGLLRPGSVHHVAIIGPGLDFSNKEAGNDFYPPQTVQPFAVLDSLIRLGLSDPATVELDTLDVSPEVNFHIARARQAAMKGKPYVVQLPWSSRAAFAPEYHAEFSDYWKHLGDKIGVQIAPIPVPAGVVPGTETRAVKVRPEIVDRITPINLDIVCQTLPHPKYDLVIETNVFVYYDDLELSLARVNVEHMLKPGGFLIANDKLPETVQAGLHESLITEQIVATKPAYMFSYQRGR